MKKIGTFVWIFLFLFGAFNDLWVSQLLYGGNEFLNIALEAFAMLPICFLVVTCTWMLYLCEKRIYWVLLGVIASFGTAFVGLRYLGLVSVVWISLGALVVLVLSYVVASKCVDKDTKYAKRVIVSFVVVMIVLNVLKVLWGRTRYYAVLGMQGPYSPVYMPAPFGMEDAFKSFPSSHTATATLALLWAEFPGIQKYEKNISFGCLIWIILTAYSRIAFGRHYLTDVCTGFLIGYLVMNYKNHVKYCEKKSIS